MENVLFLSLPHDVTLQFASSSQFTPRSNDTLTNKTILSLKVVLKCH